MVGLKVHMFYLSLCPVTHSHKKQNNRAQTFPTQAVILSLKQPAGLNQQLCFQASYNYTLP